MQTEYRDNPYVAVIAKKQRNLKKKMEKIIKIESIILSGKSVDEEQKIMYTTKSSVEKSLADLKSIQSALEEVAKEELDKTSDNQSNSAQIGSSEETKDYEPLAGPVDSNIAEKHVTIVEPANVGRATSEVVESLVKAFQVVHRYEVVTKKNLPVSVSALSQALSGDASVAQAALLNFLENAELSTAVDELFVQLITSAPAPETAAAAAEDAEPSQNSVAGAGEKAPRRRNRKRGPQSVAVDTEGAQEAKVVPDQVEEPTPVPEVAPAVATEPLPLSEVVSSIPLPSPAAIVAATADNMLVPKRSFQAATAAVLAESVEINFFPVAAAPKAPAVSEAVAPPSLPLPVHAPHVQPDAFYLAHDPAYLAHMGFQPPLPTGPGPVNSLLAGIPGFGDYSYPHHLGYVPGPVSAPYEAPAVNAAPVPTGATEGEGKKRRNRTRKGSKDADAAGAAASVSTETSPSSAESIPAAVAPVPVAAAPAVVPVVAAPAPAIVPVMGVAAAMRYLAASNNAAAAVNVPAPVEAPVVPATEPAVQSEGVEGALPKRVRRRRGKGGADSEGAAVEGETPAVTSPVTVAASTPVVQAAAPVPAVVAPPAAAETAVAAEGEEEARPRRVRGSRGKGGRGKTGGEGAAESSNSSSAPAAAVAAPAPASAAPAGSHTRTERPKPVAAANNTSANASAAPAGGAKNEPARVPRERREGDNNTNNTNNNNKERAPRPAGDRPPRSASGANGGANGAANGDRPRTARPPQPQNGDAPRNPRPTTAPNTSTGAGAGSKNINNSNAAPKASPKPAAARPTTTSAPVAK